MTVDSAAQVLATIMEEVPPYWRRPFNKEYELQDVVKQGCQAVVHRCVVKQTGDVRAVKVYSLTKMGADQLQHLRQEVILHCELKHPNVVECLEIIVWEGKLHMVLELLETPDLKEKQEHDGPFTEPVVASIMRGLLQAVEHLHAKDVVHRDIKPPNLMLPQRNSQAATASVDWATVKLIDFGFAASCTQPHLRESCGSPLFMAPEMFMAQQTGVPYGKPADLWAVGVTAFYLLTGALPFPGTTTEEVFRKAKKASFQCPASWSALLKDFITKLLVRDPVTRMTATTALQHPWVLQALDPSPAVSSIVDWSALRRCSSSSSASRPSSYDFPTSQHFVPVWPASRPTSQGSWTSSFASSLGHSYSDYEYLKSSSDIMGTTYSTVLGLQPLTNPSRCHSDGSDSSLVSHEHTDFIRSSSFPMYTTTYNVSGRFSYDLM